MTTTTDFRPFDIQHVPQIGDCLEVHAIHATVPDHYLPDRLTLATSWHRVGGVRVRHWFARHDGGQITLPVVLGDGSQDLEQLVKWLQRHNYVKVPGGFGDPLEYRREFTTIDELAEAIKARLQAEGDTDLIPEGGLRDWVAQAWDGRAVNAEEVDGWAWDWREQVRQS